MAATYEPIATTTLSSAANSITFSSIPSTYTDLRVVLVGTVVNAGVFPMITYNNSTTGYSYLFLAGNGSSAVSSKDSGASYIAVFIASGMSDTIPQMITMDIFSYAGSTYKTALMTTSGDKNGSGDIERLVGLWRNTSAITSVKIDPVGWNAGTTATLYGIKAA